jgi:site-specific DNA-methyltransferase (adenine-specific)
VRGSIRAITTPSLAGADDDATPPGKPPPRPVGSGHARDEDASPARLRGAGAGRAPGAGQERRADRVAPLILEGDNLPHLRALDDGVAQMVYADPPFNTGRTQTRRSLVTTVNGNGDRTGFGGRRYATKLLSESSYKDVFDDYLGFLQPRLMELWRVLAPTGTLYLHLDYREAHYVKLLLDELFGRENFLNELIWAYDYGAKPKGRWPQKHDTILVYVKDTRNYFFDAEAVDREPYMAPGLVTPEKAARGKRPTSVMWHTIVSPTGREKTGYPTQKPEGLLRRFVQASSRPGDLCLDPFAGSGTLGAVAAKLGRRYLLIDESPEAVRVMQARLGA